MSGWGDGRGTRVPVGHLDAPFVGRVDALRELAALLRPGPDRVRLLLGEPGIGKTALLERFVGSCPGARTLWVTGIESEASLAFVALADLLGPVQGAFDALPPVRRAALETALALRAGPPPGELAVCAAVLGVLEAVGEDEGALVIVVDDLQWIDTPSAQVLSFVARRLRSNAVTMVLAARHGVPLDVAPAMVLDGLPPVDASRLVTELARPVSPAAAEYVGAATGGNPLAILETVGRAAPGVLLGNGSDVVVRAGAALQRAWTAALDGLAPGARTAVGVVAAAQAPDRDEIAGAMDDLGVTSSDVESACRADLIRDDGTRITLRHPLIRAVVLEADPTARRRILAALADHGKDERRAWYRAATIVDPREEGAAAAADDLVQVARDATARGANDSAATALTRAAELTASTATRVERLRRAAAAAMLAGRLGQARDTADVALALVGSLVDRADPDASALTVEVTRLRARASMWLGEPHRAIADLERAAQRVTVSDPFRAALLYADAVDPACMTGDVRRARALSSTAERLATDLASGKPHPWRASTAHTLALAGDVAGASSAVSGLCAALDRADGTGVDLDDQVLVGRTLTYLERWDESAHVLDDLVDRARQAGAAPMLPFALVSRAENAVWTGRWAAAQADAAECVRWCEEIDQPGTAGYARTVLARLDILRGETSAAREHLDRVGVEARRHGLDSLTVYVEALRGLAALAGAEPAVAVTHLRRVHRLASQRGLDATDVVPFGADLVEALVRNGDTAIAREMLAWWEAQGACGLAYPRATAARCRGLLADDPDDAEIQFARAGNEHDRVDMPFERARTLLAEGETLRRLRRSVRARPVLREALAAATALGARPWAARATAELAAAGDPSGTGAVGPRWDALTPQEFQVARVVAEGLNNAEVGAALFVSHKTVEAHLTRIYRKLGVRSRTELARRFPDTPSGVAL